MAEIAGATIDFTDYLAPGTPRVINVPAAHGDATAQDLWDTLSAEAAKLDNLIYKKLIDRPASGGKSELKPSKLTGIALVMNNVQVQFEPVVVKIETGTITTPDADGKVLTDSAAAFVTKTVERGDIVLNATDGSHATVLRVVGEGQLVSTPLLGGIDNQYGAGDSYEILDQVKRAATDGDLVAQDHLGNPISPILTAFGVDSTVELSTSPGLAETGVSGLLPVESAAILLNSANLAAIAADIAAFQIRPPRGVALDKMPFYLVEAADSKTPATGKTPAVEVAIPGVGFAAAGNAAVEQGQGWYYIDLTAPEMDGEFVLLRASDTGTDIANLAMMTAPVVP